MIPTRNEDRSSFDKRKIQQSQQIQADKALGQGGAPQVLGQWTGGQFKFASPEAEDQWRREAYRQAVHPDDWHKGDPIDPQTLELVEAGAAGKTSPHFRGPDGQHRFSNIHTIEPADVRAIRARNFADKTLEEVSAKKMPGEDEAVHYTGTGKGRTRSAARPKARDDVTVRPADGPTTVALPAKHIPGAGLTPQSQQPKQPDPVLLADSSAVPLLPEGFGTSPAAAPRTMGGAESGNAGGRVPGGRAPYLETSPANDNAKPAAVPESGRKSPGLEMSPANDNVKPAAASKSGGPRMAEPQSISSLTTRPGSMPMESPSGQSSRVEGKNDIDRAVESSISEQHGRWVERVMADQRSKDPAFVADEATKLITFDLPHVIDNFHNQPGRDIYQAPTPLDIELLRGAYTQNIVGLFPEQYRPQLQKELDARPKILTSGPAGLSDVLAAMQQGEVTGFEINGEPVAPETTMYNPHGTLGSPEIRRFNEIVKEEAENLLEACKDPGTKIEHTAGAGKTEFHIQDFLEPWMQQDSRRIDVTLKFKINGQDCSFQINTADRAIWRLFAKREWDAIKASANKMRENGANFEAVKEYLDGKFAEKLVTQLNAFFMVRKPEKDKRTDEEMRNLARDTLGVLSCSEIELACRGNLVINKDPAESPLWTN